MLAQYKKQDVSGEGAVSWDKGVRCVLPEVLVYGKAVQDGTPTPDAPVMPEFSVGTEVACRGKNLFDESLRNLPSWKDVVNGTVVELLANGIVVRGGISDHTQQNAYSKGWYRPGYYGYANGVGMMLQAGETVTISCDYTLLEDVWSDIPKLIGIHLYGASGQESSHETSFGEGDTVHLEQSFTLTTTGLHYPVFTLNSCMVKITNIQIEFGDIATPYVPYFDGGTAVAPELLAIPGTEYRDTWNPQTGKGVRRVVRFEHDGSETWLKNASMGEYESFYVPKKATIPSANSIACHGLCNMFPSVEWGYIKEIEGNALMIEKNGVLEAVNLDFVVRIREYPKKKNGKKKSVVLD